MSYYEECKRFIRLRGLQIKKTAHGLKDFKKAVEKNLIDDYIFKNDKTKSK